MLITSGQLIQIIGAESQLSANDRHCIRIKQLNLFNVYIHHTHFESR